MAVAAGGWWLSGSKNRENRENCISLVIRLVLGLPGLQEALKPTGQLVIRKSSSRREKFANPSLLGTVPVLFWALRARFALRGKGTFGQGHLGHKTAHLGVIPQPGAIFCGVLSKIAVLC